MSQPRRVVVVGASAAGLRCACRLKRLQPTWSVQVVESREVFSYGACGLPYVLSGDIDSLEALRRTSYGLIRDVSYFASHKGVEVLAGWRAEAAGEGRLRLVGSEGERELEWDELVLATGAAPRRLAGLPDHPRVRCFHHLEDVAPLKQGLIRGEIGHVAVVGAGLVGVELADAFSSLWGAEVTLIEAAGWPLPGLLDREVGTAVARSLEAAGIRFLGDAALESLSADDDGVTLKAGGDTVLADVSVVAVGVVPDTALAQALGVELGVTGAIRVDQHLATSRPHVWAAGDCVESRHAVTGEAVHMPLGSLANRQGRTLANVLAGRDDAFPPVAGALAVKAMEWNVAATGCTLAAARRAGLDAAAAWVATEDRAHYWPEAKVIHVGVVWERDSGRLLGVQAAGEGEVAKRIDVATQLILAGADLERLAHLEHAYAPPYAPALDPLAVAAFAALNHEEGVEALPPFVDLGDATVIDLRLAEESQAQPFEGEAEGIPLGELEPDRLPDADELVLICQRGTRSAEGVRALAASGRRARYVGGGVAWRQVGGEKN